MDCVCEQLRKRSRRMRRQRTHLLEDGAYRDNCALASLELLRPGGILIIDDAHSFLPSSSTSPKAMTYAQGPASIKWEQFMNGVASWRCIRTTDGIQDTMLYFKPCDD